MNIPMPNIPITNNNVFFFNPIFKKAFHLCFKKIYISPFYPPYMHFNYFPIFSYFLLFFCIFLQFYTKPLQMKIPKYKNMHTKIGRECLHRFQMQFTVYYLTSIYLFPSANSSPPAKYTIPRSPGCHTKRKDCRRSRHRSQT